MLSLVNYILNDEDTKRRLQEITKENPQLLYKSYSRIGQHDRFFTDLPIYYSCYEKKTPPIHIAVQHGQTKLVQFLIQCGADVACECEDDRTTLHAAGTSRITRENNPEKLQDLISCVQILLDEKKIDINHSKCGFSPLHLAVHHCTELASMYIQAGANLEAPAASTLNHPIHEAALCCNIDSIKLLLKHGACVNATNISGDNALMCMQFYFSKDLFMSRIQQNLRANKNLSHTVQCLVESKCSHLLMDITGQHVLAKALKEDPEVRQPITRLILSQCFNTNNVNEVDTFGFFPIHYCAFFCSPTTLDYFLHLQCDINCQDRLGRTCLHLLLLCCAKKLDTHKTRYYGSAFTIFNVWFKLVKRLLMSGASVSLTDHFGRTAFHYAVDLGMLEFSELILSSSQDTVNMADRTGLYPLHIAASNNDVQLLILLLNYGAIVNVQDNTLSSPLHHACFAKASEAVDTLIKHQADPSMRNNRGETPLTVAMNRPSVNAMEIICNSMALNKHDIMSKDGSNLLISADPCKRFEVSRTILDEIQNCMMESIMKHKEKDDKPQVEVEEVLAQLYQTPGVGLVEADMPEVTEISTAVTSFVEEIVHNITSLDQRFKGTLIPSGSFFENTKVGDPDEFDFMVDLDNFNVSIVDIKYVSGIMKASVTLNRNDSSLLEFSVLSLSGEAVLSDQLVSQHFSVLLEQAIALSVKNLHPNLVVTSFSGGSRIMFRKPKISSPSRPVQCVWNGSVYKSLRINIDIVPCLFVPSLPIDAKREKCLLVSSNMASKGCHWLPTAHRLSFSLVEKAVLKSLPHTVLTSYIYAKILKNQCICPKVCVNYHYTSTESHIHLFEKLGTTNFYSSWNFEETTDPVDGFASILLKTSLFEFAESHKDDLQNLSSVYIANEIYMNLTNYIDKEGSNNITLHSYFNSEVAIRDHCTGLAIMLHYIIDYVHKHQRHVVVDRGTKSLQRLEDGTKDTVLMCLIENELIDVSEAHAARVKHVICDSVLCYSRE